MNSNRILLVLPLVLTLIAIPLLGACTKEKIVEVPIEKVVEKEVLQEVPVEKVVVKEVPVETQVIKIGMGYDLSGPYSFQCKPMKKAHEDYVRYINETGMLGNVKLEIVWGDHGQDVSKAIAAYERAKSERVVCYSSHANPETHALKDRVIQDKIPNMSLNSSLGWLRPHGWTLAYYPPHIDMVGLQVKWFMDNWQEERAPRVAIITTDNVLGRQAFNQAFLDYVEELGAEIVIKETVPIMPTDTTAVLTMADDAEADTVLGVCVSVTEGVILKDAHRLGLTEKMLFSSFGAASGEDMLKIAGPEAAEGYFCSDVQSHWYEADVEGIKFFADLTKYYYLEAETDFNYIYGINVILSVAGALETALKTVSAEELNGEALMEHGFRKMKDYGLMGIRPPLDFTTDVIGSHASRITQVTNGEVVDQTGWVDAATIGYE